MTVCSFCLSDISYCITLLFQNAE